MGRLTRKIEHLWCVEGVGFAGCVIACRYSECEDCRISDAFTKLAHYEDLEEAGRLIELPCAVGDTVWVAYNKTNGAEKVEYLSADYIVADLEAGYCIGRTKEEAERKLKELEDDSTK